MAETSSRGCHPAGFTRYHLCPLSLSYIHFGTSSPTCFLVGSFLTSFDLLAFWDLSVHMENHLGAPTLGVG